MVIGKAEIRGNRATTKQEYCLARDYSSVSGIEEWGARKNGGWGQVLGCGKGMKGQREMGEIWERDGRDGREMGERWKREVMWYNIENTI